jgi:predicted ATP-grasp superfamily ATP-dependent carboligase
MKPSNFPASQQPYAIIIGLERDPGLQAARILARRKVPIIATTEDLKHHCCRTKVCEEILVARTGEEIIRVLEELGPKLSQKAVLFPCSDPNVLHISRHRHRLEEWYHVVLPAPDVIEMLMDKICFYTYAQKAGFSIPKTYFIKSRADAEKAAKELSFPCILKPPKRTPEWTKLTTLKAIKVPDAEMFLTLYDHYHQGAETLIAQAWIEGKDANLYSCNCYFNANSEPIVTFVARKLRQWPPEAGDSSLGEECRDDVVLNESIRLFRSVNYRGLGYVEMKRDEYSGQYFMIEPNVGRPTGRSAIAEAGGVELLYAMYCDAVGWPLPPNLEQKYGGAKWISLRKDFQSALYYWWQGELSLKEWWQSWRGRKAYALFSWQDPAPFFFDLLAAMRILLSSQARKKRSFRNP